MAQYIKQGNIFGRIGTEIGKGLSESIPKEVERNRLSAGLKELNEQKDLSPQEYFTKALSVPGLIDRPQAIQSLAELAKQQGQRNSLKNSSGKPTSSADPKVNELLKQASALHGRGGQSPDQIDRQVVQDGNVPSNFQNRGEDALAQPAIAKENPTQQKFIPVPTWTPAQRDADQSREWDKNPNLSFEQIQQRSADNERRYRESPQEYQSQQDYLKGIEN